MSDAKQPTDQATPGYISAMPKWARLLKALYGVKFLDWESWEEILLQGSTTQADLVATVEWMEAAGWREPQTAVDLRKANFSRKKGERSEADGPTGDCAFCCGGMLSWYPELDVEEVARNAQRIGDSVPCAIMEARMRSRSVSTPCMCSAGERVARKDVAWAKYDAKRRAVLDAERRRAMRQVETLRIYEPRLVAKA